MRLRDHHLDIHSHYYLRLAGIVATVAVLALAGATSASASFEQVGTFGESGETRQLNEASAVAVNATGVGGAPPGTVYVASSLNRVARYGPRGEFLAAWGWGVSATEQSGGYERCGPDGEAAHPVCSDESGASGEGKGEIGRPVGIAVDQATGDVYVLSGGYERKHGLVQVFNPDGSQILSSFVDLGEFTEPFNQSPQLLHEPRVGGFAVTDSGIVSIVDRKVGTTEKPGNDFRIMTFTPKTPGSVSEYEYSGRSHDIDTGESAISGLAVDDAGDFYAAGENIVWEFSPGHGTQPVCEIRAPGGGVGALAVAPESGELFVFNMKDGLIHLFNSCVAGAFQESGTISVTPVPFALSTLSLAVAPEAVWDATRPAGVLYAVDGTPNSSRQGLGHIYTHPAALAPVVESEGVSSVTSSTATLDAQINAKGATTGYEFQYISAADYESNPPAERFNGASEAPIGRGTLPPASVGAGVSVSLSGLSPGSEYHYRVVASSHCESGNPATICEGVGADEAFRTFPVGTGQLVDGRAYELVSPVEKNGGEVFPLRPELSSCGAAVECKPGDGATSYPRVVATDGESIAYQGFPFSHTQGASNYNAYLSKRTGTGWQTLFPSPPLMGSQTMGYRAFSADLKSAVIYQKDEVPTLAPLAPPGYSNLYLQSTLNPTALTPLLVVPPPNRPSSGGTALQLRFAGASTDFSRVFFEANDALTEVTESAPAAVDGGPGKYNLYEWSEGELRLVNVAPGNSSTAPGAEFGSSIFLGGESGSTSVLTNAISSDGSRIFWSSETGQVFVRIDREITREVPDPGRFLAASADGSAVLLGDGHLYNVETGVVTDLSEGHGGFEGVVGQSEDLSRIYYVDTSVLTPGETNGENADAEQGKPNIYLWQEGHPTFVATLLPTDNAHYGDWIAAPSARTAQASPDGRWLTFLSTKKFTGYDNLGRCEEGNLEEMVPCSEAYLFDASTGKLICASCKSTRQSPLGTPAILPTINSSEAGAGAVAQPQYLDNTGRLYFNSQDALALGDTNGRVEDVYEYEPDGIGSCQQAEGCIALISTGTGSSDSDFLGVDASGKNVFFTTRDRLVPQDHDELIDIYDAREGGGFVAGPEASIKGCVGETCQSSSPSQLEAAPGSLAFSGTGNLVASIPTVVSTKAKVLTRAQELAKALKACTKKPKKKKRSACQRTARKRYETKAKAKKAAGEQKGGRS